VNSRYGMSGFKDAWIYSCSALWVAVFADYNEIDYDTGYQQAQRDIAHQEGVHMAGILLRQFSM